MATHLINLFAIKAAIKNNNFIAVCPDEKNAIAFENLSGIPTTTNTSDLAEDPTWRHEHSKVLENAKIVLTYKRDDAGLARLQKTMDSLRHHAQSLVVMHFPEPYLDFCEWEKAGNGLEELQSMRQEKIDLPPRIDENVAQESTPYTKTNTKDFLLKSIPPREHIIGPFVKQGLNMVYAPPGVGKTYFSMSLAFAIATGGRFLNWQCEIKQSVIYFDGELPAFLLQDRLKALFSHSAIDTTTDIDFSLVTPDEQRHGMPDLSTPEGQAAALELIGDTQFIVIDNISTLCRQGDENDAKDWIPVQNWLLKLRTMGKSVLLVHHSGKGVGNTQRGTSKREDVLDTVISLAHPSGYQAQDGCCFEMKFRKSRHFRNAKDTKEVVASYGSSGWEIQGLEESIIDKIRYMHTNGISQKKIAEELGITQGYVSKLISRFQKEDEDGSPSF